MPVAATVYLSETNGAGATVTDNVANCNFGGVDLPEVVAADHPIVRASSNGPSVGNSWSFQKYWRLKVNAMGDSLLIDTPKVWKSSGAYVDGEALWWSNAANVSYGTPVNTQPNNSPIQQAAFPTSEPAGQNIGIGGAYSGSIVAAPTYTNYFALQLAVNCTLLTPTGPVNQKVFIFQWNES